MKAIWKGLSAATGVLTLVVLAACGGGNGDSSGEGADSGEPIVVSLWEQMDPPERALQQAHIDALQRDLGITIERSHYGTEDLRTNFQTAGMAGGGPDLVYGPSDQVGPFSVMGLIHPIDEIVSSGTLAAFLPESFDTLNGHVFAIPDQIGNHLTLVWNKALLDHAPQNLGEWMEAAQQHTVDENGDGVPDRYGLVFEVMEPFWTIPFLTGYGGWIMDDEWNPTLDTPAMVKALQLLHDLRFKYEVMPSESRYEIADTMFKEGKAAMVINGPWSWEAYRKAGIDLGLARIPKLEPGGPWPAPMISSKGFSLNKNLEGKRLERVLEVVEYLTAAARQAEFAESLGTLPTRRAAYDSPALQEDPILMASLEQVEVGRRMPVVPEMRAIWDVMRPQVQSVWNGTKSPEDAARDMQAQAVRKIAEMKR